MGVILALFFKISHAVEVCSPLLTDTFEAFGKQNFDFYAHLAHKKQFPPRAKLR